MTGNLRIKVLVSLATFFAISNSMFVYAEEDAYYTNYYGVELTEKQYNNLARIYDEDTIYSMTSDMINALKDEELTVYSEDTVDVPINDDRLIKPYNGGVSLASVSDWTMDWETTYKKLHLKIAGSASVKTVTLQTEWKMLTKSRYYDVMGFRVKNASVTFNVGKDNCLSAYQKADGRITNVYDFNNSGVKTCKQGIGLSVKLNENATRTLEYSMTVKFASGADPYEVYGTYQHAQKSVSLKDSRNYDINSSGYGDVFDFASSVAGKYDKTEGLHVKWSFDDYLK